mmetsp:Transcript_73072/g.209783  ORF Transcript_73072/g.209783 Transcript_73072/m.209783 type:complete len:200 (-) Transcript_73072:656-1255(-)
MPQRRRRPLASWRCRSSRRGSEVEPRATTTSFPECAPSVWEEACGHGGLAVSEIRARGPRAGWPRSCRGRSCWAHEGQKWCGGQRRWCRASRDLRMPEVRALVLQVAGVPQALPRIALCRCAAPSNGCALGPSASPRTPPKTRPRAPPELPQRAGRPVSRRISRSVCAHRLWTSRRASWPCPAGSTAQVATTSGIPSPT